jgi:predicted TIM-barrel fold metal-dependent hydrolase
MIVDAHVHVWEENNGRHPYHPVLGIVPHKPAPLETLLLEMAAAHIDRAVVVQPSVYGWDNSYVAECLAREPERLAGVCLVDPLAEDPAGALAYWVEEHRFRGVRLNPIGDRGGVWLGDSSQDGLWRKSGILNVPICIQLLPSQLDALCVMAARFPNTKVVIDHLAKPATKTPESAEARRFAELAVYPNVYAKIAALAHVSNEPYPFRDILPLVDACLAAFGTDRVVWGSDFPVDLEFCSYIQLVEHAQYALRGLSPAEKARVLGENAMELWFGT